MEVSVDRSGRLVLPKLLRERLGVVRGGQLHLRENADGVLLQPTERRTGLVRRSDGRLMIAGPVAPGTDWKNLVRNMREGRIRKIAGR